MQVSWHLNMKVAIHPSDPTTLVYHRHTDGRRYLLYSSSQPPTPSNCHLPFSQLLPPRRLCSDDLDFYNELWSGKQFTHKFSYWEYLTDHCLAKWLRITWNRHFKVIKCISYERYYGLWYRQSGLLLSFLFPYNWLGIQGISLSFSFLLHLIFRFSYYSFTKWSQHKFFLSLYLSILISVICLPPFLCFFFHLLLKPFFCRALYLSIIKVIEDSAVWSELEKRHKQSTLDARGKK